MRDEGDDNNFNQLLSKIEVEEGKFTKFSSDLILKINFIKFKFNSIGYKRDLLLDLKDEEKRRVFSINDEDKFIFKTIEEVVRRLNKVFPNYSDAFILESLKGNSFNIYQTYKYLTDPKTYSSKNIFIFTKN